MIYEQVVILHCIARNYLPKVLAENADIKYMLF